MTVRELKDVLTHIPDGLAVAVAVETMTDGTAFRELKPEQISVRGDPQLRRHDCGQLYLVFDVEIG